MHTALDRILEYKREEVAALKQRKSIQGLIREAGEARPPRQFAARLDAITRTGANGLICEIKRRSPSAGDILPGASSIEIAEDYVAGGAACLSVLTDGPSFGGSAEDFRAIREAISLPMLRKDFMIDPVQIAESRAMGADCILLIMSALDDSLASELFDVASSLDMDILVEVHDEEDVESALKLPGGLIGINNRDLRRMITDISVTERLLPLIPKERDIVSESGINSAATIEKLRIAGARRFLIGEWLMKQGPARTAATRALLQAGGS